jgi:cell division protein FtsL
MLHAISVRQPPPPKTSARRISPSSPTNRYREPASVSQRFRFGPLLLSLFLCLGGIAVYMWPRVQIVRLAYRMQTSEQHLRELLQQRDQLRLEVTSLKDPQRIYRIATEQLGMSTPRPDQVVIVSHEPTSR